MHSPLQMEDVQIIKNNLEYELQTVVLLTVTSVRLADAKWKELSWSGNSLALNSIKLEHFGTFSYQVQSNSLTESTASYRLLKLHGKNTNKARRSIISCSPFSSFYNCT